MMVDTVFGFSYLMDMINPWPKPVVSTKHKAYQEMHSQCHNLNFFKGSTCVWIKGMCYKMCC
jgi:hypothetical protein